MKILTNKQWALLEALALEGNEMLVEQSQQISDLNEQLVVAVKAIARLEQAVLERTRLAQEIATVAQILRAEPSHDVGDDLDRLICALRDNVAQLEEHLVG